MLDKELNILFDKIISKNYFHGIQWSIQIENKSYDGKVGYMDIETKKAIRDDTIYRIWSMTKPVVAFATMILIERNQISLDDPFQMQKI